MNGYTVGQNVRLSTEFRDSAGALYNPTTTTLTVEDPAGTETTPSVTNDGTGLFHADVEATAPGTWQWRWLGSGPTGKKAADEGSYYVHRSAF